ncbi:DUF5131 family protein [Rhizorhabdus wittichii]|uniref:DUF5131 family protein n=1 Tax=Rhizorhabdus wittichii TaxID=160791 RepID=A0A975HBQ0_9SPHN|nr:DUF5131 family protein [Rhizorhabdus wittichii]QTH19620.1 DUF5131 family protein [Rhizorhabdus wittichii]
MAENTKIEWADNTWNPWIGCMEVSPACNHCFARVLMQDRHHRATWGPGEDRVRTSEANWHLPLRWQRRLEKTGGIETVFCLSLGDIWDKEVDPFWRREVFTIIDHTPNLLWLLLSKRIGNAVRMVQEGMNRHRLPTNVMLGATVVNQEEWDRDVPKLEVAALELSDPRDPIKSFVSMEPLLDDVIMRGNSIPDWIIVGGESGHGWRDMPFDRARSIRDQTHAHGRKFFFKQAAGKRAIPEDLLIREFVHK